MEQSRVEDILKAVINGEDISELLPPQSRIETLLDGVASVINQKLNDNQGSENAGKLLGIGDDGTIEPVTAWGTGIVVTESLVSGEDYSLNIVEDE